MTEKQQSAYFGKGINLELWKKDIETMKESPKEDTTSTFNGLTDEERQAIKDMGIKAMQDYQQAFKDWENGIASKSLSDVAKQILIDSIESNIIEKISEYRVGNKLCRNRISSILDETTLKESVDNPELYTGIPLTKKELDSLGYESDRITFQKGKITIGWFADNTFYYLPKGSLKDHGMKIEYVHQLQNLETLLNSK